MNNLSIERLSNFERDPSNNFLTRSEMMEVVKELIAVREALKGEQVPVGEVVAWNHPNEERKIDFRFLRFDVQPGTQLFTAPQKPVVLLPTAYEKSADFTEYHQGWNACRNYMLAEAKEVGGIVKDGE